MQPTVAPQHRDSVRAKTTDVVACRSVVIRSMVKDTTTPTESFRLSDTASPVCHISCDSSLLDPHAAPFAYMSPSLTPVVAEESPLAPNPAFVPEPEPVLETPCPGSPSISSDMLDDNSSSDSDSSVDSTGMVDNDCHSDQCMYASFPFVRNTDIWICSKCPKKDRMYVCSACFRVGGHKRHVKYLQHYSLDT
jgi:hypothetical protein